MTNRLRDKAWSQLGTSGSGNHFVEFGAFIVEQNDLAGGYPLPVYVTHFTATISPNGKSGGFRESRSRQAHSTG